MRHFQPVLIAILSSVLGLSLLAIRHSRAEEPPRLVSDNDKPLLAPKTIHVVIWDEQQPRAKEAYENFIGNAIAYYLKTLPNIEVKSVKLDDPEQGITDDLLDHSDVIIWWGHVRHRDVKPDVGKRIVDRIVAGKLSLIALHSAHWSQPFVQAMYEREKEDVLKTIPEKDRATTKIEYVYAIPYTPVKKDSPMTPRESREKDADGSEKVIVHMPGCIFPSWRADAKPSHVKTLMPDHPIAAGIPKEWDVEQTEMYDEPFHVPEPDAVIFEEHWDLAVISCRECYGTSGRAKSFISVPGTSNIRSISRSFR